MVVSTEAKNYIADNWGTAGCIVANTYINMGASCIVPANMPTPVPDGLTGEAFCNTIEYFEWAQANVGWCTGVVTYPITFISLPAGAVGASIWVDGANSGSVTPATLSLTEGSHDITLKKAGYQDYTQTISVTAAASYTWTMIPITGVATLLIGTDPGGAAAWLDADPDVDPVTFITKDATQPGGIDKIQVSAPAKHKVIIRKTGYEEYVDDHGDIEVGENENWYVIAPLKAIAGTDVALLTVKAYKAEDAPAKVEVPTAALKKGTMLIGFVPYEDYWVAPAAGKQYNISVVASGRATHEETITLYKDTPKVLEVFMAEEVFEVEIRIVEEGMAYIDYFEGGPLQTWIVGTKVSGGVRVETFIASAPLFKAELTFCTLGTINPVSGISKIYTDEKRLYPELAASERYLRWEDWVVPPAPGRYSLVSELFYQE